MRKKWKRYKNKIMALGMALSISCSSVFLPSMEVMASDTTTEYEDLIEGKVAVDKNGDGVLTLGEVNLLKLIPYSFTSLGKWFEMGRLAAIETTQMFKDWIAFGIDTVVGYVSNEGIVTLSDDTISRVVEISNQLRGDDGYTIYPALPNDPYYYLSYVGTNENKIESFVNRWSGSYDVSNAPIGYDTTTNTIRVDLVDYSSKDKLYIPSEASSYITVKIGQQLYFYKFNENRELISIDKYKNTEFYYCSGSSEGYYWVSGSSFKNYYSMSSGYNLLGFVGSSRVVFDSMLCAIDYYNHNLGYHMGTGGSFRDDITLDILNSYDWKKVNTDGYSKINEDLIIKGLQNDEEILSLIDDYTKEVMSSLEFIEGEQVEQTTYLKAIYELLKEWLEKIFNKIPEEDEDNDFEDTSNNQSDKLDDLIQDSQVEKPDIDNTNQLVDENLDMGNVEEYGTLLSVFTGNQRILSFILISLTVGLIAYVFYGKR